MRLGWPFRRPARHEGLPAPRERAAGPRDGVVRDAAWRGLEPLHGLSAPPALTGDTRFSSTLAGSRPLPPVLERLADGDLLSRSLGSISPILSPTHGTSEGSHPLDDPSPRTWARHGVAGATGVLPVAGPKTGEGQAGWADPPPTAGSVRLPASPVPSRLQPLTGAATQRAVGDATGASASLTRVPAEARPALAIARAGRISLSPSETGSVAAAHATPSLDRGEPPAGPSHPERVPATSAGRPLRERRQRAPVSGAEAPELGVPAARPQRAGLGAPLVARRTAAGEEGDLPTASGGTPGSRDEASRPRSEAGSSGSSGGLDGAMDHRRRLAAAGTVAPSVPASMQRAEASGAAPSAPGDGHLRAGRGRGVQRAAPAGTSPGMSGVPHETAPLGDGVRVSRSSEASETARELGAAAFTSGDTIALPSALGPLGRGRGQELLAHELVHVSQQRRLGARLPEEASSDGQALEREARSAEAAVRHGRQGLQAPLRLAPSHPRRSLGAEAPDVAHAVSIALAQGADGAGAAADQPVATTATTSPHDPAAAAPLHPPSGTQRATIDSATHGSPTPLPEQGEAELEELARKLYERIGQRLRRELLLDRERSGLLTDLR